jgi:hypothetical protein
MRSCSLAGRRLYLTKCAIACSFLVVLVACVCDVMRDSAAQDIAEGGSHGEAQVAYLRQAAYCKAGQQQTGGSRKDQCAGKVRGCWGEGACKSATTAVAEPMISEIIKTPPAAAIKANICCGNVSGSGSEI